MLGNFYPVYKDIPKPLVSFRCSATGGADVKVYATSDNTRIRLEVNDETSTWSRDDLLEFIKKTQEVIENTRPEVK